MRISPEAHPTASPRLFGSYEARSPLNPPASTRPLGTGPTTLSRTKFEDDPVLVEILPATADAGTDPLYGGVGIGWGKGSEVASVTMDGPAQRAGVVPGDVFWKVNEQELSAWAANPLIRGPVGTPVRLAFHRADGGVLDETMIREAIDPNALRGP